MLKKMAGLMLLVAALSTTPVFAGFEFHGYARAGVLLNSEGGQAPKGNGDQGTLSINGPATPFLHNIGRLGNENNNYLEAELTNTFKAGAVGGAFKVRLASKDYEYASQPVGGNTENNVYVRELYSEMNNLPFAPKAIVWAGKRFYGRDDIHINDYYWRIFDGTGAGIMNVPAGPGSLDVAWLCHTTVNGDDYPIIADKGRDVQQNFDIRYNGVKVLGGEVSGEVTLASSTGKVSDAKSATSGVQGALIYSRSDFAGIATGNSKIAIQYGTGLGAALGQCNGTFMNEDAEALQVLAYGVADVNEKFKISPSFAYKTISSREGKNCENGKDSADWFGITVRPQYNFTRNLALVAELGYENGEFYSPKGSWGDGSGLKSVGITKLTIAPTITLDNTSFWTRPQLRAFVTLASFDKAATQAEGNGIPDPTMTGKTSGTMYGVQMEAWW